jgi:ABC-type nitrate/sulfonate/bicarbonate transport system substrate-binding protein
MKIAVPDLISNSYIPAPAAVELGFFAAEGLDMSYELIFPVDKANEAMRDGAVDFVAGSAHSTLAAFPGWDGAKLVCALSQGMYWLLVMRTDLAIARGDVAALKGRHIGAAPWVELGLRRLLSESGIDPDNDLTIAPVPGTIRPGVSFGVTVAKALEDGKIDGFWANAMGAEVAVRSGAGTVVLDPRRGLGPASAFDYTWPTLATTDALIERDPETVAAAVRAIVKVQAALVADVGRATEVGDRTFPAAEAAMIADVVARDLDFYDATLTEKFVAGMNRFAVDMGLLDAPVAYDQVVATRFSGLWTA